MALSITSNNRPRKLVSFDELPEIERADFDYVVGDETTVPRFVRAYGSWYDVHEFEPAPDAYRALGWNNVQAQSAWNAITLRWFDADGYEFEDGAVAVGWAQW